MFLCLMNVWEGRSTMDVDRMEEKLKRETVG